MCKWWETYPKEVTQSKFSSIGVAGREMDRSSEVKIISNLFDGLKMIKLYSFLQ